MYKDYGMNIPLFSYTHYQKKVYVIIQFVFT